MLKGRQSDCTSPSPLALKHGWVQRLLGPQASRGARGAAQQARGAQGAGGWGPGRAGRQGQGALQGAPERHGPLRWCALKKSVSEFDPATVFCNETHLFPMLKDAGIGFQQYEGPQNPVEAGITGCEFLVARSGTVMVSSAQGGGRQLSVYPPVHIVIAHKNQLVESLEEAYSGILEKYNDNLPSQIALITGPSRTADIEKTLVLGAHGPKEIRVFLQL